MWWSVFSLQLWVEIHSHRRWSGCREDSSKTVGAEADLWGSWARLASPILVRWGNGVSWGGAGTEVKVTCSHCDWHQRRRSHLALCRASSPSNGSGRSGVLWPRVPVRWHAAPLAEGASDPLEAPGNENKCVKCHTVKKKIEKRKKSISVICSYSRVELWIYFKWNMCVKFCCLQLKW